MEWRVRPNLFYPILSGRATLDLIPFRLKLLVSHWVCNSSNSRAVSNDLYPESRPSSIHFPFFKGIRHSLAHSAIWHPMNVSYARRTDRVLKRKHWQSATQFIAQFWVYSIELEIISFLWLIQQLSEELSTLPSIIQFIPFSDMFLELTKLYPHFSTGSWDYWNLTSSQDKAYSSKCSNQLASPQRTSSF